MIHTKELRFGNKIKTTQGKVITVQQILSNTIIYDSKLELNHELVLADGSRSSDYHTQLNEIVQEADVMTLFLFRLQKTFYAFAASEIFCANNGFLKIGNTNFDWEFVDGKLRLRNPAPCLKSIQYLHQLQNFLFAIADYELDFPGMSSYLL